MDDTPEGTSADRESFREGQAVLTLDYRQQVILDTGGQYIHGGEPAFGTVIRIVLFGRRNAETVKASRPLQAVL